MAPVAVLGRVVIVVVEVISNEVNAVQSTHLQVAVHLEPVSRRAEEPGECEPC
jgi:hypothetical protein